MASFGRGGGRGGGGGRHHHHSSNRYTGNSSSSPSISSSSQQQQQQQPKLQACRNFLASGSCPHGPRCNFAHAVRHHATVDASDKLPQHHQQQQQQSHSSSNRGGGYNKVKERYKATSVAVWETPSSSSGIKLFVASHDGKWRLYDTFSTAGGGEGSVAGVPNISLVQEFEHFVGGPVDALHLLSNSFLFAGFESAVPPAEAPLDANRAGMIRVWNLHSPSSVDAPAECRMHVHFARYASSGRVRCLCTSHANNGNTLYNTTTTTAGGGGILPPPPRVWSGGNDGVIREWSASASNDGSGTTTSSSFALVRTMGGHLGAVTKLALSNNRDGILWSGGVDGTIRLWNVGLDHHDHGNGEMAHLIPAVKKETAADPTTAAAMMGHSAAITGLLPFDVPSSSSSSSGHLNDGGASSSGSTTTTNAASPSFSTSFIFTSSLDETVKVWNAANGSCVASERHGQGVTAIAFTTSDASSSQTTTTTTHPPPPLLICGLYYGDIMIRGTISNPPLCLLLKLSHNFTGVGHELGPIHDVRAGPGGTFYAVGEDGKLTAWQIVGDFGL